MRCHGRFQSGNDITGRESDYQNGLEGRDQRYETNQQTYKTATVRQQGSELRCATGKEIKEAVGSRTTV